MTFLVILTLTRVLYLREIEKYWVFNERAICRAHVAYVETLFEVKSYQVEYSIIPVLGIS